MEAAKPVCGHLDGHLVRVDFTGGQFTLTTNEIPVPFEGEANSIKIEGGREIFFNAETNQLTVRNILGESVIDLTEAACNEPAPYAVAEELSDPQTSSASPAAALPSVVPQRRAAPSAASSVASSVGTPLVTTTSVTTTSVATTPGLLSCCC